MTKQMEIEMEIPNKVSGRMMKEGLENLATHLHLATDKDMSNIPLWLLEDLAITCKNLNLEENYQKVLKEIQMNLEAQQRAYEAEQRAEKAELLNQRVTAFVNSMMKKYQAG